MQQGLMSHFFNQTRLAVWARLAIFVYGVILFAWFFSVRRVVDRYGQPLATDFITFYSASIAARSGQAHSVYDKTYFQNLEQTTAGARVGWYAWHYPPTFFLLTQPLAFFSYKAALLLWLLITIVPILLILQRIYPGRNTLAFFLSFPATFQVFLHGQNGFLTAALLSGGCMLLNGQPFSGGLILGLLSYKPHLCILVLPALAAGKHWKALQGFFFSLFSFTTATFLVYGSEPWKAFLNNIPMATAILEAGAVPFAKMPTPYAAIRLLGVQPASASLLQGVSTLLCLLFVVLLWRSRAGKGIKAAGLIAATLLASPFGFDYDLIILFPAMAFLFSEFPGNQPFTSRLAVLGAAIWAIPLAGPIIASMTGFNIMPLVILALCVACGKCAKAG